MTRTVHAGFMPLLDCAPLIVAAARGFAGQEGLDLVVLRETSWATVRDRLAVRHLDVAHMLAPMPIAANLGLGPLSCPMQVPMSLGFGGNTVSVSRAVWEALSREGAPADFDAARTAVAMARVVATRKARGEAPLVFAVVHTHSAHHYELAYWLASAGIVPGADVELILVPPSLSAAALAAGQIDGFCAGEPWGSVAVAEGAGVIVTTKAHIWRASPEKVLGVRSEWADAEPHRLDALLRAVYRAAVWCDDPGNRDELSHLLARPEYIGQPAAALRPGLERRLTAPDGAARTVPDLLTFADRAATFPWISHALWLYTQMVRWRQAEMSAAGLDIAAATYRPDLYRRALAPIGAMMPSANSKIEGALAVETPAGASGGRLTLGPDGFFDGQIFDPENALAYLESLQAGTSDQTTSGA